MSSVIRDFPDRDATLVHQTGATVAHRAGVEIVLHIRDPDGIPICAELISGDLHAEIGLCFFEKELEDFDGAFSLPREVGEMLRELGFEVAEDFFS